MKRGKKEHLILDGYNVIHAWPELAILCEPLEHARDRLVDIMAEYGAFEHFDITIVFDAPFVPGKEVRQNVSKHLNVVFTDEGETADSYIEKLTYHLVRQEKEVYVVTSDRVEQSMILGAGAYRIPSRELRKSVKKAKKRMQEEYIAPQNKIMRRELGGRIQEEIARKLDELRRKH